MGRKVYHAAPGRSPLEYTRVNPGADLILAAFVHATTAEPGIVAETTAPAGCYKVRAVDVWGNLGPFTSPVCIELSGSDQGTSAGAPQK